VVVLLRGEEIRLLGVPAEEAHVGQGLPVVPLVAENSLDLVEHETSGEYMETPGKLTREFTGA
jgi:hypothetical protein